MAMEFEEQGTTGGTGQRRRRVIATVVAAMLVAGAAGLGYGLGRSADDGATAGFAAPATEGESARSATLDDAASNGSPEPTEADAKPTPTDPLTTDTSTEAGSSTEIGTTAVDEAADLTIAADGDRASGGFGWAMFGGEPMQQLFDRVTDSGLVLQAHLGPLWDVGVEEFGDGSGWTPAPWCYENGQLRIAVAGDGVIDVGGVGWFSEPFQGRAVSWLLLGTANDRPMWAVVVQVPNGTTAVTATFADGATDTTVPQNGVAVLIVPTTAPVVGPEGYWDVAAPSFEVAFDGATEPVVVDAGSVTTWDDPEYQDSCSPPPPALPEPGEQPADPAAAEAAVVSAMEQLYDPSLRGEVDPVLLVDDTGVADARAQVQEGGFAAEADSATAVVEELVFTSPSEAWFRYRVDTSGVGLSDRYGVALLVDGVWLITRDTVCQDLSMAGGDCGAGWQYIYPPGTGPGVEEPFVID